SGKDNNSGAGVVARWCVESERGRRNVAETHQRLAGDQIIFGSRRVDLRARIRLSPWRPVRPKRERGVPGSGLPRWLLGVQTGRDAGNGSEKKHRVAHDESLGFGVRAEIVARGMDDRTSCWRRSLRIVRHKQSANCNFSRDAISPAIQAARQRVILRDAPYASRRISAFTPCTTLMGLNPCFGNESHQRLKFPNLRGGTRRSTQSA